VSEQFFNGTSAHRKPFQCQKDVQQTALSTLTQNPSNMYTTRTNEIYNKNYIIKRFLKTYLVFGPDGIGISAFVAASEDDVTESFMSVSAAAELSKVRFAVCEIESSTVAAFAIFFTSAECDLQNIHLSS